MHRSAASQHGLELTRILGVVCNQVRGPFGKGRASRDARAPPAVGPRPQHMTKSTKAWGDPPVPNVTELWLYPQNVTDAAALLSQSTYALARAVGPHPGKVPGNVIRRRMPATNAPRIQVQCPPRTSCTWFTQLLMTLFPKPQSSHSDYSKYGCQERPLPIPMQDRPWIYKTTFGPQQTLKQWGPYEHLTYKVAFFRDPISTLASAADERWRGTCGGFYDKLLAADVMARLAYTGTYYDAVLFAENVYPSPEATMREIGAIPENWEALGQIRNLNATAHASTTAIHRHAYPDQHSERKACILMPFLCTLYGYGHDPRYGKFSWRDDPPKSFSWRTGGGPDATGCGDRGCGFSPKADETQPPPPAATPISDETQPPPPAATPISPPHRMRPPPPSAAPPPPHPRHPGHAHAGHPGRQLEEESYELVVQRLKQLQVRTAPKRRRRRSDA